MNPIEEIEVIFEEVNFNPNQIFETTNEVRDLEVVEPESVR